VDLHDDHQRPRADTASRTLLLDALLPEHDFNLARALVGSEGTCVTVLEATVRLMEAPRARALLVLGFRDIYAAADSVMETPDGLATYRAFIDEAADLVVAYGGSLSGEHGDGQSRAELLPKMFGNTLVAAFREFKRIWDPDRLMNPGKLVDGKQVFEGPWKMSRPAGRPWSCNQVRDRCRSRRVR
jgi:FAD/FMN-containing dehydrogenase